MNTEININDLPFSKGFMKFGCVVPSKIMFDFDQWYPKKPLLIQHVIDKSTEKSPLFHSSLTLSCKKLRKDMRFSFKIKSCEPLHMTPGSDVFVRGRPVSPGYSDFQYSEYLLVLSHPQLAFHPAWHPDPTPHICQFWSTTTLFRPVKGAPKRALICDKYPKMAKTGQNLAFLC